MVALTQANGLSIVHETVYENRFGFTKPRPCTRTVSASPSRWSRWVPPSSCTASATIQLYRECLGSLPCRFRQRNYKHSVSVSWLR